MSSPTIYALETEEHITVNKVRNPQAWMGFSTEDVRCFCNLPQCVSTGYMCKSSEGGCFSNFLDHFGHHSRDYRGRHGCLELLSDKEHRSLCESSPQNIKKAQKKKYDPKSLIFCCYHDMCNHVDSPQTKHLINNTYLGDHINNREKLPEMIGERPITYTDSQVWFRAATIAVPVCGAVILFVLIALAIKILRSENQNSSNNKLGWETKQTPIRTTSEDLQRIQMPLLIQNHIAPHGSGHHKNDTNAKQNLISDYKEVKSSVILDIEKMSPKCLHADINLVSHLNRIGEKFVNSDDKICKMHHPV